MSALFIEIATIKWNRTQNLTLSSHITGGDGNCWLFICFFFKGAVCENKSEEKDRRQLMCTTE